MLAFFAKRTTKSDILLCNFITFFACTNQKSYYTWCCRVQRFVINLCLSLSFNCWGFFYASKKGRNRVQCYVFLLFCCASLILCKEI